MNWLYWDRGDHLRIQKKVSISLFLHLRKHWDACYPVKWDLSANFTPVGKRPSKPGCQECPTGVRCVTSQVAISSKFHLKGHTETLPLQRVHPLKKKWESGYHCAAGSFHPNTPSNHLSKGAEGIPCWWPPGFGDEPWRLTLQPCFVSEETREAADEPEGRRERKNTPQRFLQKVHNASDICGGRRGAMFWVCRISYTHCRCNCTFKDSAHSCWSKEAP